MEITKESIEQFYIAENHNYKDSAKHFGITARKFMSIIQSYGISKRSMGQVAKTVVTRTHESYVSGGKKSSDTQRRNWEQKSDEEKSAWSRKMSESHKTAQYQSIKALQNSAYRSSLTDEENAKQNQMRSESMKEYWASLSKEEKDEKIAKQFSGMMSASHIANTRPNLDFMRKLEENNIPYQREFRIGKYAYDFLIGKTVVEINPSVTHNITWSPFENNKANTDKHYHSEKTQNAIDNGYRCIHIWDWDDVDKIIDLLKSRDKIYARLCVVEEISEQEAEDFINTYHLQGYVKSELRFGLRHNGELVAVMTFGKPRYNHNYQYELLRFCAKYSVTGGSSKLFHYFIENYKPSSVISYCDNSKFSGNTYINLGFIRERFSYGKHWYNVRTKVHITDNLLRARGFDQLFGDVYGRFGKGTNNDELMRQFGFVEIIDAGQSTYIYKRG